MAVFLQIKINKNKIVPKLYTINQDGGGQGVRSMEGGWEGEYFKEGD